MKLILAIHPIAADYQKAGLANENQSKAGGVRRRRTDAGLSY
ncbi:MAG: hypothetical protein QNJ91_05500 [Gammaproteobacteria bacterium]|nr:hypothetical protein [Gammaproteobacteria bacterium]